MNRNLLMIMEVLAKAFNQDWIINVRSNLFKNCEKMISLLENR